MQWQWQPEQRDDKQSGNNGRSLYGDRDGNGIGTGGEFELYAECELGRGCPFIAMLTMNGRGL